MNLFRALYANITGRILVYLKDIDGKTVYGYAKRDKANKYWYCSVGFPREHGRIILHKGGTVGMLGVFSKYITGWSITP